MLLSVQATASSSLSFHSRDLRDDFDLSVPINHHMYDEDDGYHFQQPPSTSLFPPAASSTSSSSLMMFQEEQRYFEQQQQVVANQEEDDEDLSMFVDSTTFVPLPLEMFPEYSQVERELHHEEGYEMTVKDAYWFLDALEEYSKSTLTPEELNTLETCGLRSKAKHRNAILFQDDADFLFHRNNNNQLLEVEEPFNGDRKVSMLHEATKIVLRCYERSRENAPPKSCIWSALMHRVAYFLRISGVPDVRIDETVEGVAHKESTLFVQGYHISRSNFTKLARQLLKKESRRKAAEAAAAAQ